MLTATSISLKSRSDEGRRRSGNLAFADAHNEHDALAIAHVRVIQALLRF